MLVPVPRLTVWAPGWWMNYSSAKIFFLPWELVMGISNSLQELKVSFSRNGSQKRPTCLSPLSSRLPMLTLHPLLNKPCTSAGLTSPWPLCRDISCTHCRPWNLLSSLSSSKVSSMKHSRCRWFLREFIRSLLGYATLATHSFLGRYRDTLFATHFQKRRILKRRKNQHAPSVGACIL